MPERVIRAVCRAIFDTQLVSARILLAIAEFFWAILLLWPGDTFDRPTYSLMAHVMGEESWGFLFLITSIIQAKIVLTEDFHTWFARDFAFFNACVWSTVVFSMLLSVYPPPAAISGEIALMFAAVWIWVQPIIIKQGILYARKLHPL